MSLLEHVCSLSTAVGVYVIIFCRVSLAVHRSIVSNSPTAHLTLKRVHMQQHQ
jgi:hypothetical protein